MCASVVHFHSLTAAFSILSTSPGRSAAFGRESRARYGMFGFMLRAPSFIFVSAVPSRKITPEALLSLISSVAFLFVAL